MKNLLLTPDFDGLPCLQKLILDSCDKLEEIHPSLGKHKSIEYVNISRCDKLRMFPTIVRMKKLRTFEIKYCPEILEFPNILSNMESLVNLSLASVGIQVLPLSIGEHCTNLTLLNCYNLKTIKFNLDALKHLKDFTWGLNNLVHQSCEVKFHQLPRSLQKLDLRSCHLKDGEIPHAIVELSNLEELYLGCNGFSRLDFSLTPLTKLKLIDLSASWNLVTLPEFPASLAILKANDCYKLNAIGDVYINCKCLCRVSLMGCSIKNDGGKLLEYMLQGKAIEYGTMILRIKGLEIAKGFQHCLQEGNKCTLQLPENWCNDFCGFLMYAVYGRSFFELSPVEISMKKVMTMDCERDVAWKSHGYHGDTGTWIGYVSFDSLKHTSWWNKKHNKLSFDIDSPWSPGMAFNRFGVQLLARKSRSEGNGGLTETCDYTRQFDIIRDSASHLKISLGIN